MFCQFLLYSKVIGLCVFTVYILFIDICIGGIMPLNTQNLTRREDIKSSYPLSRCLREVGRLSSYTMAVPHSTEGAPMTLSVD